MSRQFFAAAALALAAVAAPAFAADAPAATAAKFTTSGSSIGDLLDNPAAKAVLEKHLPQLVANPQMAMARALTLKQIQGYAGDAISDDVLAKIDVDLAKIK